MQRRGISLVALVITIIVLIILTAGVIMLAGGENGIIGRAQRAVEENNKATATEKVLLEVSNIKMEVAGTGQTVSEYLYDTTVEGDTTKGAIRRAELDEKEISISATPPTGQELVFTVGDYLVTTDLNGNILSTEKNGEEPVVAQPQESNVMVVASSDGTGTALGAGTQTTGTTTYISFEANLEGGTITSVTYNGTNPATTITVQGNKYVHSITSNGTYSFTINGTVGGEATSKTFTVTVNQYIVVLGDAVRADRYGDKINYGVSLPTTTDHIPGWKIFYEDSDYMYIIAGDYLANSELPNTNSEFPNGLNMSKYTGYPYSAYWADTVNFTSGGSSDIDVGKASQFGLSWLASNGSSTNINAKATADLFHQAWTDKFGHGINDLTCIAIGGPTLEMYAKSWNATHPDSQIYYSNASAKGYSLGDNANSMSYYVTRTVSGNPLYYPHPSGFSTCNGYWIASPSVSNTGLVMYVDYGGNVNRHGYNYNGFGVRPVVSLSKSDIQVSSAGAGVWNVSKQ